MLSPTEASKVLAKLHEGLAKGHFGINTTITYVLVSH
jgi:hypothetical protein